MKKKILNTKRSTLKLKNHLTAGIKYPTNSKEYSPKHIYKHHFRRKSFEQAKNRYIELINALHPRTYINQH